MNKLTRWMVAAAFGCGALVTGPLGAQETEELKIEYPKPVFIGTKIKVKLKNLEPPGYKPPVIKVPKGTKNVALDKTVTSSDPVPIIGELELVTDGDTDPNDGSFVELGPGTQWVQIDLEATHDIFAIALWHFHKQARAYKDVIIQVSDDPEFVEGVKTLFNNDDDNSSEKGVGKDKAYVDNNKGRLLDTKGTKGRYVRLYSNGNTSNEMNHYVEVAVYGQPAK